MADLKQADINLMVRGHELRLSHLEAYLDIGPPPLPEPVEGEFYTAYFVAEEVAADMFDIRVYLRDVHKVGKFSSFQFKANFPPGIETNFLSAEAGPIVEHFGFGYQAADGHPKEGLVGGYASSMDAIDGMEDGLANDELFVTLHFRGPFGARFGLFLDQWSLTLSGEVLPANLPANITHL